MQYMRSEQLLASLQPTLIGGDASEEDALAYSPFEACLVLLLVCHLRHCSSVERLAVMFESRKHTRTRSQQLSSHWGYTGGVIIKTAVTSENSAG